MRKKNFLESNKDQILQDEQSGLSANISSATDAIAKALDSSVLQQENVSNTNDNKVVGKQSEDMAKADVSNSEKAVSPFNLCLKKIKLPLPYIFFFVVLLFMELFLRLSMDSTVGISVFADISLVYTVLFSAFFAGVFNVICNTAKSVKNRKIIASILILVVGVCFLVEYFLKQVYGNYMSIAVILMSAQNVVGSYSDIIIGTLIRGIPVIILYLLPFALALIFGNWIFKCKCDKVKCFVVGIASLFAALGLILGHSNGAITDYQYFTTHFDINKSTTRFGLMSSFCLDSVYAVTGTPKATSEFSIPAFVSVNDSLANSNITEIDFKSINENYPDGTVNLITDYVYSAHPTNKNEYTGYFEGKNLILICAEAFTPYVIDENDTPTLYKLANNGFVFNNYYQPSWMVSTSDGEYTLFTSLIPKYGSQSMYLGRDSNWYYTLANSLKREGYATYAYHNHNYQYYNRDITHPNLGYDVYMGMGNGMEAYVTNQWPESDFEMMKSTVDLFVNSEQPFHVYYLTVSGHTEYNFYGNNMAYKNEDNISDTMSSEAVRAIKACNMELEYALTSLMAQLEVAGVLDDTVIVLSPDHYPYGLSDDAYNELAGVELDPDFERYHNKLIIYNSAMEENVIVDDYCCGIDVLPTLLNLFGIEYDSRLLMGSDIFSDAQQLVLFQDYSWITDKGRYEADSGIFYPSNEEENIDEAYIQEISNLVSNKVLLSKYILETDYYNIVFGNK